jgi:hypothetical protein
VRQGRAAFVAGLRIQVEVELRAGRELDPTFGEIPEAEFRPLQIGKNADWSPGCTLHSPDRRKPGAMVVMRTVAKVEPEHVDTRLEECADLIRG